MTVFPPTAETVSYRVHVLHCTGEFPYTIYKWFIRCLIVVVVVVVGGVGVAVVVVAVVAVVVVVVYWK